MASGVNVKMGVSGVAQFKQSINQAKTSLKTLDAQLALTEKQYKASGDAETYMQQKSEQLQAKLEAQKQVAAAAEKALQDMTEKGVDKSTKAFQDMIVQLAKAKGDMLDTQSELDGIGVKADEAGSAVDGMNYQLQGIGKGISWQNVTTGLSDITSGMQRVMSKAFQMGEAIVNATLGAGSWADEIKTTAAQYQIDPEDLQRMRKTANIIDTDVDAIINAQKKLKKGVGSGNEEVMGAFAALFGDGYNPNAKGWENAFWDAGEALLKFTDAEKQEVYAQRLFGRSWNELIPLFQAGREEYEKTNASWNVVEKNQLDNLGKMDDAYQKMQGEWETFKMEMLEAFSGPLTEGMETITGLFKELNAYLDTPEGQAMLKQIGDTISGLITDLTAIDPSEVVAGLKSVVDGITKSLKWIVKNKETVVTAVEGFIGAWAVMKTASGVATALKLIDGIKGLKAGGAAASAAAAGASTGASWGSAFASAVLKAAPWLAGLYTLLNPAASADNDKDLITDGNGNLTQAGKDAGWRHDESGDLVRDLNDINDKYVDKAYQEFLKEEEARNEVSNGMTEAQRAAAEAFWDAWRADPENIDDAYDAFEKAFEGNEDIFDKLDELMTLYMQRNNDQDQWRTVEDIPDEVLRQASKGNSEMASAANTMKGIPGMVSAAVETALSKCRVVIDGQQAGRILAPHIGNELGGVVATLV